MPITKKGHIVAKATSTEGELHYQMGEQAAWQGHSVDAMPHFKRATRAAAWLKGHADGSIKRQQHADGAISRTGFKRMADLVTEIFGEK
jgi:hypothetical protein